MNDEAGLPGKELPSSDLQASPALWALGVNIRRASLFRLTVFRELARHDHAPVAEAKDHAVLVVTYFQLWMSWMHLLVETWQSQRTLAARGRADLWEGDRVDALCSAHEASLAKRIRDATFHPSHLTDPRLQNVFDTHEAMGAWADALLEALREAGWRRATIEGERGA